MLAQHFVRGQGHKFKGADLRLTQGDVRRLTQYDWPGNVRDLENVIERAAILARNGRLRIDLPESDWLPAISFGAVANGGPTVLTDEDRRDRDRANILVALAACGGKAFGRGGAAELLEVKPTTLASRMKALGTGNARSQNGVRSSRETIS